MITGYSIGQDSHAFITNGEQKELILGGVLFENAKAGLRANSDGDVVLHALTNAVSGVTCKNILGKPADIMCKNGVTDSREYLKVALADLAAIRQKPYMVSFTIECLVPKITPKIEMMRESIGGLLGIPSDKVGITATTGEGLTAFGRGEGIQVFCILTTETVE